MYGNWAAPLLGIPWNIGQFAVGILIAVAISEALCRTPAKAYFAYKVKGEEGSGHKGKHVLEN